MHPELYRQVAGERNFLREQRAELILQLSRKDEELRDCRQRLDSLTLFSLGMLRQLSTGEERISEPFISSAPAERSVDERRTLLYDRAFQTGRTCCMTVPNFANRTMWTGDNLDIMRGMMSDCVDLIYLDRPFNFNFNFNRTYSAPVGSEAAELVKTRIEQDNPLLFSQHPLIHRTDIPKRTDQGELPNYRTHKHLLFGQQEGRCAGCEFAFPFRNFQIDHKVPRSKGGSDHYENLQLLCAACNAVKGDSDASISARKTGADQRTKKGSQRMTEKKEHELTEGAYEVVDALLNILVPNEWEMFKKAERLNEAVRACAARYPSASSV